MQILTDHALPLDIYQQLIRIITPRPIAWVSTISEDGVTNLAPFSFFCGVGSNPPTLLFCPANRRDGSPKDSMRNAETTGEFVVNIVSETSATKMNETAVELAPGESEFQWADVASVASIMVKPPRVAESLVQMECSTMQILHLGDGPGGANIVLGRILMIHADDRVIDDHGLVDPARLHTIGRVGGTSYCRTSDTFDLPRPRPAPPDRLAD